MKDVNASVSEVRRACSGSGPEFWVDRFGYIVPRLECRNTDFRAQTVSSSLRLVRSQGIVKEFERKEVERKGPPDDERGNDNDEVRDNIEAASRPKCLVFFWASSSAWASAEVSRLISAACASNFFSAISKS